MSLGKQRNSLLKMTVKPEAALLQRVECGRFFRESALYLRDQRVHVCEVVASARVRRCLQGLTNGVEGPRMVSPPVRKSLRKLPVPRKPSPRKVGPRIVSPRLVALRFKDITPLDWRNELWPA